MSNSLRPHESQHSRPPCPSPTPGVHSNSCPLSRWCHPAISSSVAPFSSCPQSLLASESFPMSQLFVWGGQSTGVSALASFLPSPHLFFRCWLRWHPTPVLLSGKSHGWRSLVGCSPWGCKESDMIEHSTQSVLWLALFKSPLNLTPHPFLWM